ncbi:MAG: oligosaccharide flippase family protein [Candidatus Paceibacterota bacterium]
MILGPSFYGNFHFFTIALTYLAYLNLGIILATERDVPFFIGKGDAGQLKKVQNVAFSSTLILAFAAVLIGLLLGFVFNKEAIGGITIILLIFFSQQIVNFYETISRGHRNFSLISKRIFLTSLFNILFTVGFGYFFGLVGSFFGLLTATAVMAYFYWLTYRGKIKIEFDKEEFFRLLKTGFPILMAGLFYTLLSSVDSIFVYVYFGSATTGLYSLAFLLFTVASLAPRVLGIIVYPRFLYQYSREKENDTLLYERIKKTLRVIIIAISLPIGLLFFLIGPIVQIFLPGYAGGLAPAKIILIASLFLSIAPIQGYFLIAKKQLKRYLFVNAFSLSVACLAIFLVIKFCPAIVNIALAASLGYFINGSLLYLIIDRQFVGNLAENIFNLLKLYLPFAYFFFSLFFCVWATNWITIEIWKSLAAIPLFLAMCSPLIIQLNKEFNIFNEFFQCLKSFFLR